MSQQQRLPTLAELAPRARRNYVTIVRRAGNADSLERALAVEMPIAIEYNGFGYAVMMASPDTLEDFALGFSLSERIIASRHDVTGIEIIAAAQGLILRIQIADYLTPKLIERARQRVSEGSCGLCGLENLEQVMRPLAPIRSDVRIGQHAIFAALQSFRAFQPLNRETGAVHGAAFCTPSGEIVLAREDVGRHNALDKLIGALAAREIAPASGFFLLSARCSYELVEKTIIAGCPVLVTISAPTTLASDRAKAHDLTLVALARADAILVITDNAARIIP